jgi:hypothetical protein
MQSTLSEVIRDAAVVVKAYVLGLRESSVMSLLAGNFTNTEERMTVHLVLLKNRALRHATPATHVQTGAAGLPSQIYSIQRWTARRGSHLLLLGFLATHPSGNLAAYRRLWHACCFLCCVGLLLALAGRLTASALDSTQNKHSSGFQSICGRQDLSGAPTVMI